MDAVFTFIIILFGDLLIAINNIPFFFGYTLLQFLVAGSFVVLIWQLVIYILSRSSGSVRSSFRHGLRHNNFSKSSHKNNISKSKNNN